MASRTKKSITNAKVNLLFYFLLLVATFFSRKIFIESLGDEFVGLSSTLLNMLGLFNLAELGISSAISFSLYKPIYDNNKELISELISIFGYLYRKIGYGILVLGVIVSCFIPIIFGNTDIDLLLIYIVYYAYLSISLFTYFFNYKQTLLVADQKEYYVTIYYQSANILKIVIQIFILLKYKDPYIWIFIELFFGIIYCFILNYRVKKVYPWLDTNINDGKSKIPLHPELKKYIKQIFVHKLASVALLNLSSVFIYTFGTLTTVAYYINYNMIILKIDTLITQLLNSTCAGVGNLVAEGEKMKIKNIFGELLALRYYISIIFSLCIYFCIDRFIEVWLGDNYILSNSVVILMIFTFYLKQTGEIVDQFLRAYGLFYDVWAPLAEVSINVIVSICCGYFLGLEGVLLGPVISMVVIVHIWKPYFLYKKGLECSVFEYWFVVLKYTLVLMLSYVIFNLLNSKLIEFDHGNNIINMLIYSIITFIVISFTTTTLMYIVSSSTRTFISRLINFIIK